MKGGSNKREDNELEILLGEIPLATSECPQIGVPDVAGHSPEQGRMCSSLSNFSGLYSSPRATEDGTNIASYGGSDFSKSLHTPELLSNGKLENASSCHNTLIHRADQEAFKLPNGKLLGLTFGDIVFANGPFMKQNTVLSGNSDRTSHNHSVIMDGQSVNHPNYSLSEHSSIPSLSPSVTSAVNGVNICSSGREGHSSLLSINGVSLFNGQEEDQELQYHVPGSLPSNFLGCQSFPVNSGSVRVSPATHAYQLLPSAHVPSIELSPAAYRRQYYMDTPSPVYISPPNLDLPNMRCQDMQGRHSAMNQQYFHPGHLQNRGSIFNHVPVGGTIAASPLLASTMQPCFERPLPQQIEQGLEYPFLNSNGISREFNQLNLSPKCATLSQYHSRPSYRKDANCLIHHQNLTTESGFSSSPKVFLGNQILDKVGKQYFPENVLIKSREVKSLTPHRSDAILTDQLRLFTDYNERMLPSSQARLPLVPSNRPFHLYDHNSEDLFPGVSQTHSEKLAQMRYNCLEEVVGRILPMAKDHHECHFLQKKLAEGTSEDVWKILVEIVDHIVELMTDPIGSHLVQKLLDVCNDVQKMQVLKVITRKTGELVKISCNMYGSRSVQKVIETSQTRKQYAVLCSSLKPGIVLLMKDINGNHVANRCLQYLLPEYNQFIFDAAVAHCVELATDRHGCCVLQRCLYHSNGTQKHDLMSEISYNSVILSQDPYGNYVVQSVLEQKAIWAIDAVLEQLEGNYEYLSMQKYSSNVVETCLKVAGDVKLARIIQELINNPHLLNILLDRYGNYVIQSALFLCKGSTYAALAEAIRPHIPALRISSYGNRILQCLSLKK